MLYTGKTEQLFIWLLGMVIFPILHLLRVKLRILNLFLPGFDKIVDLLIKGHANINQQNNFGRTALQKAIENGKLRILQRIFQFGIQN